MSIEQQPTPQAGDPVDLELVARIRSIARRHGYAIGVHGSMGRDIDLIAASWTDAACAPTELVSAIMAEIGYLDHGQHLGKRSPGGRHSVILFHPKAKRLDAPLAKGHWEPKAIDLSIAQAISGQPVPQAGDMPRTCECEHGRKKVWMGMKGWQYHICAMCHGSGDKNAPGMVEAPRAAASTPQASEGLPASTVAIVEMCRRMIRDRRVHTGEHATIAALADALDRERQAREAAEARVSELLDCGHEKVCHSDPVCVAHWEKSDAALREIIAANPWRAKVAALEAERGLILRNFRQHQTGTQSPPNDAQTELIPSGAALKRQGNGNA